MAVNGPSQENRAPQSNCHAAKRVLAWSPNVTELGDGGFPGLIVTVPGASGRSTSRGGGPQIEKEVVELIGGFDAESMVQQKVDPPRRTAERFGSGAGWLPG